MIPFVTSLLLGSTKTQYGGSFWLKISSLLEGNTPRYELVKRNTCELKVAESREVRAVSDRCKTVKKKAN